MLSLLISGPIEPPLRYVTTHTADVCFTGVEPKTDEEEKKNTLIDRALVLCLHPALRYGVLC